MKHLLRCYMRKFVCLMKGRLHCFVEFVILQGFSLRAEAWDTIFPWSSCASRGRWLDLLKIFFKYFRSVQHGRVLSVAPCQIPHCSYPGQTVSVLKMQIFRIFSPLCRGKKLNGGNEGSLGVWGSICGPGSQADDFSEYYVVALLWHRETVRRSA